MFYNIWFFKKTFIKWNETLVTGLMIGFLVELLKNNREGIF